MSYVGQINAGGVTSPVASTLYGTCDTAADDPNKVVTCPDFDQLITGVTIHVKFKYADNSPHFINLQSGGMTSNTITLNVNGTGAKSISGYNSTPLFDQLWTDKSIVSFTYDGTYWVTNNNGIPGLTLRKSGSIVRGQNIIVIPEYNMISLLMIGLQYYDSSSGNASSQYTVRLNYTEWFLVKPSDYTRTQPTFTYIPLMKSDSSKVEFGSVDDGITITNYSYGPPLQAEINIADTINKINTRYCSMYYRVYSFT